MASKICVRIPFEELLTKVAAAIGYIDAEISYAEEPKRGWSVVIREKNSRLAIHQCCLEDSDGDTVHVACRFAILELICRAYEGGKPDATCSFKDEDFYKMNPQIAFMRGAMKVRGSLSAAQKFTPDILPKGSKM